MTNSFKHTKLIRRLSNAFAPKLFDTPQERKDSSACEYTGFVDDIPTRIHFSTINPPTVSANTQEELEKVYPIVDRRLRDLRLSKPGNDYES